MFCSPNLINEIPKPRILNFHEFLNTNFLRKQTNKSCSNDSKQNSKNLDFMVLKIGCIGFGEQDVRIKESCDYFFIHNYHTTFYEQGCVYNF